MNSDSVHNILNQVTDDGFVRYCRRAALPGAAGLGGGSFHLRQGGVSKFGKWRSLYRKFQIYFLTGEDVSIFLGNSLLIRLYNRTNKQIIIRDRWISIFNAICIVGIVLYIGVWYEQCLNATQFCIL